jgi:hypothetical protein
MSPAITGSHRLPSLAAPPRRQAGLDQMIEDGSTAPRRPRGRIRPVDDSGDDNAQAV